MEERFTEWSTLYRYIWNKKYNKNKISVLQKTNGHHPRIRCSNVVVAVVAEVVVVVVIVVVEIVVVLFPNKTIYITNSRWSYLQYLYNTYDDGV